MSSEQRVLIYFDDVVNALVKEYGEAMDLHLYSPREILEYIGNLSRVDAVEVVEYDAVVAKLENLLCHATGGKYSKAGYSWEDMERMVTDYIEECCEEAVADYLLDNDVVPPGAVQGL